MKHLYAALFILLISSGAYAHTTCNACTPAGDQTTYGANNVWIGYVYQGRAFTTYAGWVNEGASGSPNFDESFGGANTSYATNGCPITTQDFAVRYKLTQAFTSGTYIITVGGDDGYRFSLDGGSSWAINNWGDHSYTTTTYTVTLNGSYNMVLEYYENGGDNRVTFNIVKVCMGTEDQSVYGTGNVWNGYIYQGMNFDTYKGKVTEGVAAGPDFDESFGNSSGSNTATYTTSSCSITTYQFSARYRLTKTLTDATYTFTVGGDDGYRFSLDGGATWVINKWNDQSYTVTSYNIHLNGTYNMVLEYYDNGGYDRVSFAMTSITLPVTLISWSAATLSDNEAQLTWQASNAVNFDHYVIQRSTDGEIFQDIHTTPASTTSVSNIKNYAYTDTYRYDGTVYYRLVMVDLDGHAEYSKILSLSMHQAAQAVRIFPTVVNNDLYVETSQSFSAVRFELYDMSGVRIRSKDWSVLAGRQTINIKASGNLPAGAYIARLTDGRKVLVKQVILVR
ncbi:MAG TPA: PA14 domain-containing protein [Puia sp.]|nr:PA14 domain-containing protein [Puia sp.]